MRDQTAIDCRAEKPIPQHPARGQVPAGFPGLSRHPLPVLVSFARSRAGKDENSGCAILVVEQLGSTLGALMRGWGKPFSLKTVCQVGIQMLKIVHALHDKGVTHGNLNL